MDAAAIRFDGNQFFVSGQLTFANVMRLLDESRKEVSVSQALIFDLSGVTKSDSAGLALLIEWIKVAKVQRKSVSFKHVPAFLLSLARASSLDEMISV